MSVDFSNTLIVAVSATALFDLSESERFFQALTEDPETAIDKFRSYMIERENDPLQTGTGYPLIKAFYSISITIVQPMTRARALLRPWLKW